MREKLNQPREDDVVLGGKNPPPVNAIVLGGVDGVKHRLASSATETRIAALSEALKYGEVGIRLAIAQLNDESKQVQAAAYKILQKRTEPSVKQALQIYSPYHYQFLECLETINSGHSSYLNVLALSDRQYIASGSSDKTVRVWDINTGKLTCLLSHDSYVFALALSIDGQTLYTNSWNEIKIWDLRQKRLIRTLKGHDSAVISLVVSPDGALISSSQDKTINIWHQPRSGRHRTLTKHSGKTNSVKIALSSDGKRLIGATRSDRSIEIWDWKKRKQIGFMSQTIHNSNYYRGLSCITISPDGKMALGAGDNAIDIWNLHTKERMYTITWEEEFAEVESIFISPDGKALFCGMNNGTIKIWDLFTGKEIHTLRGHSSAVTSIAISSDGLTIISGSIDTTIKIWGLPQFF